MSSPIRFTQYTTLSTVKNISKIKAWLFVRFFNNDLFSFYFTVPKKCDCFVASSLLGIVIKPNALLLPILRSSIKFASVTVPYNWNISLDPLNQNLWASLQQIISFIKSNPESMPNVCKEYSNKLFNNLNYGEQLYNCECYYGIYWKVARILRLKENL